MMTSSLPSSQPLMVADEFAVIAMRQEVRQLARGLALTPTQQAKITAASSSVARDILLKGWSALFTIHVHEQGTRSMMEVLCAPQGLYGPAGERALEDALNLGEARMLVDDVRLSLHAGRPQLALHIWLTF